MYALLTTVSLQGEQAPQNKRARERLLRVYWATNVKCTDQGALMGTKNKWFVLAEKKNSSSLQYSIYKKKKTSRQKRVLLHQFFANRSPQAIIKELLSCHNKFLTGDYPLHSFPRREKCLPKTTWIPTHTQMDQNFELLFSTSVMPVFSLVSTKILWTCIVAQPIQSCQGISCGV